MIARTAIATALRYRDFAPEQIRAPSLFRREEHEQFTAAVDEANAWIEEEGIDVLNVETVVLPNVWSRHEEGTVDGCLTISGSEPSRWYQLVRVWYRG